MIFSSEFVSSVIQALSNLLAACVGAYFTLTVFHGGQRSKVARERLDKVYIQLFNMVEPYLYRNIPFDQCRNTISKLKETIDSGGVLVDPTLRYSVEAFLRKPKQDSVDYKNYNYSSAYSSDCYLTDWYRICAQIDYTFDKLCRDAFLPLRKISYRLNNRQYITKTIWVLNALLFIAPYLLGFILIIMLVFLSLIATN